MTDYHLTDEQLSKAEYTYTTGGYHGAPVQEHTVHGLTRDEFNDLPEWRQRDLYYEYSSGANAGKWDDPKNALPRGNTPERGDWNVKAEKGYEVDPGELRQIAKDMKYKLDIWKRKLDGVGTTSIGAADLGNTKGAPKFVELATASKTGFQQYIGDIEKAYNGVIAKLKMTADQYDAAHGKTDGQVKSVNPSGNPNLS